MTYSVDSWENLPEGEWLETDEHGTHWYLDHEGRHWYSDEHGYHVYQSEEQEASNDSEHEPVNEDQNKPASTAEMVHVNNERKPRAKVLVALAVVLMIGSILGYLAYSNATEPTFYDEVYWTDSGRAFVFETNQMNIVFPNNGDGCEEWSDEFQTFAPEEDLCVAVMQINDYTAEFQGGDAYDVCYQGIGAAETCLEIHVLDAGVVVKDDQDVCRIFLNNIEPSNIDRQSPHAYSQVILNGNIRFDIDDAWTAQFLLKSRAVYDQADAIDCFFEQFEYEGPRVVFDLVNGNVGEAMNDTLATATVVADQYSVDYQDIELYVFTESGEHKCELVEMVLEDDAWVEGSASGSTCTGQLYNTDTYNTETLPEITSGDQLVFKENDHQICNGPCEVTLEIRHLGEVMRAWSGVQLE